MTDVRRCGAFVSQANQLPTKTKSTRPHIDHTDDGASSAKSTPYGAHAAHAIFSRVWLKAQESFVTHGVS